MMQRTPALSVYFLLAALVIAQHASQANTTPPSPQPGATPIPTPPPLLAEAAAPCAPADDAGIQPRVSARHDFGDGVGYYSGFTYVEGFVPFLQDPGSSLAFADGRVVNFDHSQQWECQLGGGARWLLPTPGVVVGLNAFYDGRNTEAFWLHQVGLGWEALGELWQARGNVYLPVGPQRFGLAGSRAAGFVGTNVLLDVRSAVALRGVDAEVGRQLPSLVPSMRTSAFLGLYHYSNEGARSATGVRARLESWYNEDASLHLSVQHDDLFKTTVTGGLAFHLGGVRRGARQADPLAARLGERVVRDPNVAVSQQTNRELAIDPGTGKPVEVRHVASFAAPGGDGSIERPFQTLPTARAGSAPGQILFAHAGSVFAAQSMALQNGQRFLGEGVPHFFTTRQGIFLLPRATSNTAAPIIRGSVLLANGNEVSGFRLTSGGAITGTGITGADINRNFLEGGGGIDLVNVAGPVAVTRNTINGYNSTAIRYDLTGAGAGVLNISDNVIGQAGFVGAGQAGINVRTQGTSQVRAVIVRNSIARLNGEPAGEMLLTAFDGSSLIAQVARNNFGGGFARFQASNSAFLGLQLFGNSGPFYVLSRLNTARFQAEDTLATNVGPRTLVGGIEIVPVGTFGFTLP